jgi:hypothetical protein
MKLINAQPSRLILTGLQPGEKTPTMMKTVSTVFAISPETI